jgi:hypothetical protein
MPVYMQICTAATSLNTYWRGTGGEADLTFTGGGAGGKGGTA